MSSSRLEYLFSSYVNYNCTVEEEKELMELLELGENKDNILSLIDKVIVSGGFDQRMSDQVAASILQKILQRDKANVVSIKRKRIFSMSWMRVASVAFLFLLAATYWIFVKENKDYIKTNVAQLGAKHSVVLPGGNHAVLTLSDGSSIVLDSIQNGKIQHGNAEMNKQDGILIFNGSSSQSSIPTVSDNVLSTPRGGKYQIVLPDGSNVWLNASSTLQFPTVFTGNKREVKLTGEAYFEVTKNNEKQFNVIVGNMEVKVLGTHFDINAYDDDDAIKTSLLEGSVKISKGNETDFLKPGQQAVLEKTGGKLQIRNADMDAVMAWKNGLFQFEGADITTIMKEIGRWYNVDIVYAGKVPVRRFEGKISRSAKLSEVLRILELSNVKFKEEGNKIIVQ